MKKLLIGAIILLTALIIISCDCRTCHTKRKARPTKESVKVYRDTSGSDLIYWYLIHDTAMRNYYYASSPSPSAPYSSLNWSRSATRPAEIRENEESLVETQEVELDALGESLKSDINSDFDTMVENSPTDSLDSMEGVPDASDMSSDSSDSSSFDSGGDSGSFDSGGGGDL